MVQDLPPIIPSVWTIAQRDHAVLSPWPLVHVAGGGLKTIKEFVQPLVNAQKTIWIHPDMIAGLAKDREGLDVLNALTAPAAIATSNLTLAHQVRQLRLKLVLRVFIHDTQSLESSLAAVDRLKPDVLCCLPAVVYPLIRHELNQRGIPVVAAGLVRSLLTRDHLIEMGATVEIGQPALWSL
ncbi:MAG: glycerol-3-phosphate responsive antiterminator [Sulfobacillus sp.]